MKTVNNLWKCRLQLQVAGWNIGTCVSATSCLKAVLEGRLWYCLRLPFLFPSSDVSTVHAPKRRWHMVQQTFFFFHHTKLNREKLGLWPIQSAKISHFDTPWRIRLPLTHCGKFCACPWLVNICKFVVLLAVLFRTIILLARSIAKAMLRAYCFSLQNFNPV